MKFTTLTMSLLSISIASARIGETKDELIARYGPITQTLDEGKTIGFKRDNFTIVCHIDLNVCDNIAIAKTDVSNSRIPMSTDEVSKFLMDNRNTGSWGNGRSVEGTRCILWNTNDGKLMAMLDRGKDVLTVATPESLRRASK